VPSTLISKASYPQNKFSQFLHQAWIFHLNEQGIIYFFGIQKVVKNLLNVLLLLFWRKKVKVALYIH